MGHPRLSVDESILFIYTHAYNALHVNYGVVMVSRYLERANENDGFKMTALEFPIIDPCSISLLVLFSGYMDHCLFCDIF